MHAKLRSYLALKSLHAVAIASEVALFFVSFAAPAAVTHDCKIDEAKSPATRIVQVTLPFVNPMKTKKLNQKN